jgi:hypothetical protein
MERIQVNGVWYVREKEEDVLHVINSEDISHTLNYAYEDRDLYIEASFLGETIFVTFLDKSRFGIERSKEEFWDNDAWIRGVYEGNPESLEELKGLTEETINKIRSFFRYLFEEVLSQ